MHCCLTEKITMGYNESLIPLIKLFTPQSQRRKLLWMFLLLILNRLGLSTSYYEIMRIDTRLAKRTIMEAGNFRVPFSETIESGTIVQGAMDNFDHDENTMSGKNGSHDTILMLFQNSDVDKSPQDIICNVPENFLKTFLGCRLYTTKNKIKENCEKTTFYYFVFKIRHLS